MDRQIGVQDIRHRRKYLQTVSFAAFPEDHVGFTGRISGLCPRIFRDQDDLGVVNPESFPHQNLNPGNVFQNMVPRLKPPEHHAYLDLTQTAPGLGDALRDIVLAST